MTLQQAAEKFVTDTYGRSGIDYDADFKDTVIKHFLAGANWQQQWISAEDGLPENLDAWSNDQVLFAAGESVRMGCYDYEDGFWHEYGGGKYMDILRVQRGENPNGAIVTHWMPLPTPPNQGKKDERSVATEDQSGN